MPLTVDQLAAILDELTSIVACAEEFDLMLISDEVYEHFTLDAADQISTASLPGAFERTITVSSFSKSWAISGWRLGYACGPGELVSKLTQLGNIYYVCTPTPLQHGVARDQRCPRVTGQRPAPPYREIGGQQSAHR